jgi:SSS family solute:Na+ symporter
MLFWNVATAGGDQMSVQRFMSTADVRAARRAYAIQLSLAALVGLTLACVGFALLAYFSAQPDSFGSGPELKGAADKLFPRFIAFHLPPVVSGLVLAGVFAAAMSSFDSGVNSITAVVTRDFLDRFGMSPADERAQVRALRGLAAAIGAAVIIGSCFMKYVPGNLLEVTGKTANLLAVPIFCLFFFALFVKFASPAGVWIGTLFGIATAALIAFSGPIFGHDPVTGRDPISFQWVPVFAFVANIAMGIAGSLLFRRRQGIVSV